MATSTNITTLSFPADAAVDRYTMVIVNTDGQVAVPGAADVMVDGIIYDTATVADVAFGAMKPVVVPNYCEAKVIVGTGGLTVGALFGTDASGHAVAAGTGNGDIVLGKALEAGGDGDIIRVLFGLRGQINA